MHHLTVVRTYLRVGLLNLLQYRVDAFFSLLDTAIWIALQLLALSVIFNQTDTLAGWTQADLITLSGVYLLIHGLINIVVRPSMWTLSNAVRDGSFDFVLLKPADSQLLASVQTAQTQGISDIVSGVVVIGYGLSRRDVPVEATQYVAFAVMLVLGMITLISAMLLLASMAFWIVETGDLMRFFRLNQAGAWPLSIYPGWLRVAMVALVPVAVAVTIPAQALTGRMTWETGLASVAVTILVATASRLVWRAATKRYTGASA